MKELPNLNVNATVEIKCTSNRESKAIHDSLLPDNVNFPKNLELDMRLIDSMLSLELKFSANIAEENSIKTLLNTFDELMEHAGISKNVIKND